jgi:putative intracellular protease/amidase
VFVEVAPGRFALTSPGERLVDPPPELDLTGIGGRMAEAWATLPAFVRTGEPAYHERFGLPFWDDLATRRQDRHADGVRRPGGGRRSRGDRDRARLVRAIRRRVPTDVEWLTDDI